MTSIIASFACHKLDSNQHTLSKTGNEYKHERTWFNTHKPTDRKVEISISEDFNTVATDFLISANISLDSTKDYNADITDEQRLRIRDAMNDVREHGEYLEGNS